MGQREYMSPHRLETVFNRLYSQDAINYVVCARLRNVDLREKGKCDENAAVLRVIETENDPIVKEVVHMWHTLERTK